MLPDTLINNRYRIIRPLGGGGMANVYLAHDEFLNRDVTCKCMRLDMKDDQTLVKRFQREAVAATELVHDNVVQIYDVGEVDGSQYIIMEYVDGTDLKSYIANHFPIPYQQVIDIMLQVLSAVQAAHEAGIIHRDLKPQNILIDKADKVKITDFGIAVAKFDHTMTQTNTVVGSIHYLSPEQTRGSMASDKSDIYALGVILYEMLTKKVPYEGETAVSIALKHANSDMPSVRDFDPRIPQALENVILKATTKLPQNRYASAQAMLDDLRTALSPRRANEQRFVPLSTEENETRIIPMDQIQSQLRDGVTTETALNKDDMPIPKTVDDQIIEYGAKNYHVKTIAKLVERTPNYVRDVLRKHGIKFKDRKRWPWVLVLGLLIVLGSGTVYMVNASNRVKVPNVVNDSQADAERKIKTLGLNVGTVTRTTSKSITKGHVISSDPKRGARAYKDDTVNLIISTGRQKVRFGDYVGSDYDTISTQLRAQGYSVNKKEIASNDVDDNKIINQSLNADDKVDPTETTVDFTVSTGPAKIQVPDFTDSSTRADVESWATGNNIIVNFNEVNDNKIGKGKVISQSIRGGSTITVNDTLMVTISLGTASSSSSSSKSSSSSSSGSSSSSSDEDSSDSALNDNDDSSN